MYEQEIQVGEGTRLTFEEMASDVRLAGWDNAHVLIRVDGEQEELSVAEDQAAGEVSVSARTACEIWVPSALPVSVEKTHGNFRARELRAALALGQVHGDLKLVDVQDVSAEEAFGNLKAEGLASLHLEGAVHGDAKVSDAQAVHLGHVGGNLRARDTRELSVGNVSGDLMARDVDGTLNVGKVGGNAVLSDVTGPVTLERTGGDLLGKDLLGGARVGAVGGNLVLSGALGAGGTYQFKCGGDAVLKLDEDAGAHISLRAGGQVLGSVELGEAERSRQYVRGTLGQGGAELAIDAGGNVVLRRGPSVSPVWGEGDAEWDSFGQGLGEEISRQVQESLAAIDVEAISRQATEQIERAMARLRNKLESMDWERLGGQAQHAVERAMAQMQRDIDRLSEKTARQQERAARQAERAAERQQRRAGRATYGEWTVPPPPPGPFGPPPPPGRPPAPEPPSFTEERMAILKMVETGKITPEEASKLLDALR
jgi:hypothetical protein